jgi:hypothetical protein
MEVMMRASQLSGLLVCLAVIGGLISYILAQTKDRFTPIQIRSIADDELDIENTG